MPEDAQSPDTHPIQHVVVLMLENHSFDQMLGDYQSKYKELDGIDPAAPARTNIDPDGQEYPQAPTTTRSVDPDPRHELDHVLRQIESDEPLVHHHRCMHRIWRLLRALVKAAISWIRPQRKVAAMRAAAPYRGRFVLDYSESYPGTDEPKRRDIMGYYERGTLPALHALADQFTICDRWFASVPGPTWTNRFFVHTGTSLGIVRMPDNKWDVENYDVYDQATIYDRLNERKIPWRIYYHDVPQSLALSNQWPKENKRRYRKMDQFEADVAGPEAFPAYVFIEPQYLEPDPNDDHPPYDIFAAQALIARVYNAIRANEPLWNRTLLVILYDEHGGFYDHAKPPAAVAPDDYVNEYSFDRFGVRVPALLISPWVKAGVYSETLDHTSLLRYLSDRWNLGPLGTRVEKATSFADAIRTTGALRTDTLPSIPSAPKHHVMAMTAPGPKETQRRNENQEALKMLSEYLDAKATAESAASGRVRALRMTAPQNDSDAAAARVERFLDTE